MGVNAGPRDLILSMLAMIFAITAIAIVGCSGGYVKKKGVGTFTIHSFLGSACHACHRGTGPFRGSEELLAPGKELCLKCHVFKTEKKFVHPAIRYGGCLICHNPHGSSYPYLLRRRLPQLCFGCHESESVLSMAVHKSSSQECTDCHNPHMSDNKFLLQ